MSMGVYPGHALFRGRRGSTGAGGLRRSSYNTKLERRLSNSYTLPRNTTSKDILIKLEAERAKREQEKEEEKAKKEEQLFKKMGIKAPTGITHDQRRRSEGVIADLQKYRLGNVRPSRKDPGMTDELKNILYPPPTSARPSTIPTTYGNFHSPGHHGSEYSHPSSQYHHSYDSNNIGSFNYQVPAMTPRQPAGWSWTPEGGWIYRLPPSAPPPVVSSDVGLPIGLSPQHYSSSSDQGYQYQPDQASPPNHPSSTPYPPMPKSILKSSRTGDYQAQWSDTPSSSRQVHFRQTPDIAPPHYHPHPSPLLQAPAAEYTTTTTPQRQRQVPQWTLHKERGERKRSVSLDSGQVQKRAASSENGESSHHTQTKSRSTSLQDSRPPQSDRWAYRDSDSRKYVDSAPQVPPILQQAHQRLLDFDDHRSEISGKCSGRTLIQELERMAEHKAATYAPPRRLQERDRPEPLPHQSVNVQGPQPQDESGSSSSNGSPVRTIVQKAPSSTHSQQPARSHPGYRQPPISQNPDRAVGFYPIQSSETLQSRDGPASDKGASDRGSAPEVTEHNCSPPQDRYYSSQQFQVGRQSYEGRLTKDTDQPDYSHHRSKPQVSHKASNGGHRSRSQRSHQGSNGNCRSNSQISRQDLHGDHPSDSQISHQDLHDNHRSSSQASNGNHRSNSQISHQDLQDNHGLSSQKSHQAWNGNHRSNSQMSHQSSNSDHHPYSQASHPAPNGSQTSRSSSKRRDSVRTDDMPYHPSPSPDVDQVDDAYSDRSHPNTPEQPPPKRFRLTDGAWVRYDIPSDKLPAPSPIKPRAKRPDPRKQYWKAKSEPLSQVSQIEEPEDSQERQDDRYYQDETIESNWSHSQSERGRSRGQLDRIDEEEEQDEVRRDIPDLEPIKKGAWADPDFFDKTEGLAFTIYRDGY